VALALLAAVSLWSTPAAAADPPPAPAASTDPPGAVDLTPSAGETSGYDDLAAAIDLVNRNPATAVVVFDATAPLVKRRVALSSPDCRRALSLIHDGFAKLMQPPADNLPVDLQRAHPDFSAYLVGRVLATEEIVYFADGRTGAAIDTFRQALLVPDVCLPDRDIDSAGIDVLARHMAQWSQPDCERMLSAVRDRIASNPEPGVAWMSVQRQEMLAGFDGLRAHWPEADSDSSPQGLSPSDAELFRRASAEWNSADHDPVAQERIVRQTRQVINAVYDRALERDPFGAEVDVPSGDAAADDDSPPGAFAAMIDHVLTPHIPETWRHAAQTEVLPLLVLGTHAAIRRYRWEYARLPASLADLKMPDITTDPCTGQLFDYAPTADGASYTITVRSTSGNVIDKYFIGPYLGTWK
jgi:hypothetical protein